MPPTSVNIGTTTAPSPISNRFKLRKLIRYSGVIFCFFLIVFTWIPDYPSEKEPPDIPLFSPIIVAIDLVCMTGLYWLLPWSAKTRCIILASLFAISLATCLFQQQLIILIWR